MERLAPLVILTVMKRGAPLAFAAIGRLPDTLP